MNQNKPNNSNQQNRQYQHEWDEEGICVHCGFDGAEWWHWKHMTYEGKASEEKQPLCTKATEIK